MEPRGRGMPAPGEATIEGRDPFFRTPFRVGETAAACLAAIGRGYRVHASLCRSAMMIQAQGHVDGLESAPERLSVAELAGLWIDSDAVHGPLRTLGPVLRLSGTPGRWSLPTPKLGLHVAEWSVPDRGEVRAEGDVVRQPSFGGSGN